MEWYDGLLRPPIYGDQAADSRRTEFDVRNTQLVKTGARPDIVFIGDSITQLWETNVYFGRYGLVINRGIGGDILPIIRERFAADAVQLHPHCCVLLGGINSLWETGAVSLTAQEREWLFSERLPGLTEAVQAMIFQCREAGIPLIIGSPLPLDVRYNSVMPDKDWTAINHVLPRLREALQGLCAREKILFADYYTAVKEPESSGMLPHLSIDGIHPYAAGYDRMAAVLYPLLDRVLNCQPV